MTLVFPSMFVLRTRRICWKFGGLTSDIFSEKNQIFYWPSFEWVYVSIVVSYIVRFTRSPRFSSWRWGWSHGWPTAGHAQPELSCSWRKLRGQSQHRTSCSASSEPRAPSGCEQEPR